MARVSASHRLRRSRLECCMSCRPSAGGRVRAQSANGRRAHGVDALPAYWRGRLAIRQAAWWLDSRPPQQSSPRSAQQAPQTNKPAFSTRLRQGWAQATIERLLAVEHLVICAARPAVKKHPAPASLPVHSLALRSGLSTPRGLTTSAVRFPLRPAVRITLILRNPPLCSLSTPSSRLPRQHDPSAPRIPRKAGAASASEICSRRWLSSCARLWCILHPDTSATALPQLRARILLPRVPDRDRPLSHIYRGLCWYMPAQGHPVRRNP
ncbi:hypothetical protein FB567DRAFT_82662 [Paraphoma chrysanthemicola]|uniref:Uncharacterized protein n=1 Tax=Paraphoma chrysanthemicola TaxID=798071 RepID=A0A8K0R3P1_9PLEO|nr:hypothetical protein FB567DRAFT_82662 [Paraphoma chrysanthemicola]